MVCSRGCCRLSCVRYLGANLPSSAAELAARDYGALARAVYGMGTVTASPTEAAAEVFATSRSQFAEAAAVFAGNNRQMAVWLRKAGANTLRVALLFAAVTAAGLASGTQPAPMSPRSLTMRPPSGPCGSSTGPPVMRWHSRK